jgi:hypothetical protein
VASAIHSVTLDTAGYVAYTDALGAAQITASAGVIQGMNLPYVLSDSIDSQTTGAASFEGDAAGSMAKYNRLTKETYVKLYVKCAGLGSTDTYSLSYALDGSASATVGTGYGSTANPFIMVEGLDDGMHSLVATCTDSAGVAETYPTTFNWKVDTTTDTTVVFDAKASAYSSSSNPTFDFHSTIPSSAAVSSFAWQCSMVKGSGEAYAACGAGSATASSSDEPTEYTTDGTYEFKARVTITYDTTCALANYYCADLAQKVNTQSYTFVIDTAAPDATVTSSPSAKSQFSAGKTATFEWSCPSSEVSCTYACIVDGMDSADATSSSRSKGSFACTSPMVVSVANTTTHSFAVQATDAAGNTGSWSSLYMFYADGTSPTVEFTKMDDSVSYTAQQLASGATYYASSNDYNIATGGKLYYDGGSTEAILDETNYNANDTQWVAGLTQSVIQYTTAAGAVETTIAYGETTALSTYHTVLQFPYDPTKGVYELDGTYGAILAMKKVNEKYYYNVLDTTNADFGTISYRCKHPEILQ